MVLHIEYILAYKLSKKCDFWTQLFLKRCNKYLYKMIKIESIPESLMDKLTDDNLRSLSYLTSLSLRNNNQITEVGLKHLFQLTNIDLEWKYLRIRYEKIKNLRNLKRIAVYFPIQCSAYSDEICSASIESRNDRFTEKEIKTALQLLDFMKH